jgi:hypothetical protein
MASTSFVIMSILAGTQVSHLPRLLANKIKEILELINAIDASTMISLCSFNAVP